MFLKLMPGETVPNVGLIAGGLAGTAPSPATMTGLRASVELADAGAPSRFHSVTWRSADVPLDAAGIFVGGLLNGAVDGKAPLPMSLSPAAGFP